jgi:superfamily II DNA or RNA helicase
VGRLHRIHDGKKFVRVYDYVDAHVPMFARMYEKRLKKHRAIGYELKGEPDNDADVQTAAGFGGQSPKGRQKAHQAAQGQCR